MYIYIYIYFFFSTAQSARGASRYLGSHISSLGALCRHPFPTNISKPQLHHVVPGFQRETGKQCLGSSLRSWQGACESNPSLQSRYGLPTPKQKHNNGDAGMAMLETFNVTVSNNIFDSNRYGIRMSVGCAGNVFSNNVVSNSTK